MIKYRSGEINYLNSDATWHTLLTIEAYNETPISDHLFLPIVSLGGEDDKFIPWGATIPDDNGNYYYTSFSPAGYVAPWLFMKLFHLEVCEKSLYMFNTVLLAAFAVLWMLFLRQIYDGQKRKYWVAAIGVLSYVLTPEIFHGMGIVYWHQSLMQVTLLAQIMAFWRMKTSNTKTSKTIFYLLALFNPYLEWTGYVANVGFALAEMVSGYRKNPREAFCRAFILGGITVGAFGLFTCHYLLRVDPAAYFSVLRDRFLARSASAPVELYRVFGSYFESFLYIWVLLFCLLIWIIAVEKRIEFRHGLLMLVLLFPVVENLIMKQHALEYSYDRMKAGFALSFLLCEFAAQLITHYKGKTQIAWSLVIATLFFGCLNLNAYRSSSYYIWSVDYRSNNSKLAAYVNSRYSDSVIGVENAAIRGYMNLLFHRGIYEFTNTDWVREAAMQRQKQYAVMLNVGDIRAWDMLELDEVTVYDIAAGSARCIALINNEVVEMESNADGSMGFRLSTWTDQNWTNGYSNTSNTLLFEYDAELLIKLLQASSIMCNAESFTIEDIDYDRLWIRVTVDRDASMCMYPSYILLR